MVRPSAAVPILVGIALFLSIVIAFASLLATVSAEEAEQPATEKVESEGAAELPDDSTLLKMKVRELKAILEKKGPDAACLACTSKREYVDRIRETADWPEVEAKKEEFDTPSMEELGKMFDKSRDKEQVEELRRRLKEAGIDTSNIFTGDDLNSAAFEEKLKKWSTEKGGAAESAAKEESHVDL